MFRHFLKIFSFLIFALVFSILGSIALDKVKAWTEAPGVPPNYGVSDPNSFKPISRGDADEYKTGQLGIFNAGDYANYGLTIGNSASTFGGIKAETGSANPAGYFANYGSGPAIQLGSGGIKFSDGSTQNTSASVWASNGDKIYNTNTGNVGIGTTSPSSPLSIANGDGVYGGLWIGQGTGKGWIYYGNSTTDWKVGKMNTTTNNFEIRHHDDTSYFTVTPTGNIGIGTTSPPVEKLEVIGTIRQAGASADGSTGIHIGDSAVRLFQTNDGNKSLGIYTNATEKMRILGNGNVGIGTTDPAKTLEVAGTIRVTNSGQGIENIITSPGHFNWRFGGSINVGSGFEITPSTVANGFTFNNPAFVVLNTGFVGIGATPSVKLEVAGEAKFGIAANQQQQISIQGSNAGTNLVAAAHEAASLVLSNLNGGANTFAGVKFRDAGGNYVAGISGVFVDNASNRGELAFITRNGANINERMRIDKDGNVGIGTTAPGYPLDIKNSNNSGTAIARLNQDNATKLWTGAVLARQGIEKWFVGMDNNTDDLLFRRNTASNDMVINNSNGNVTITNLCLSGVCNSSWPSAVNYWTKTGNDISNNNAGNVNIGTTSQSAKLQINAGSLVGGVNTLIVKDDVNTRAILVGDANSIGWTANDIGNIWLATNNSGGNPSGAYVFLQKSSGDVGIGTPTPLAKLDVYRGPGSNAYDRVMADVSVASFPKIYFGDGLAFNSYIGYDYPGNERMVLNSRNATSHYEFQIAGSEKVRIDANGNVGIRTTAPGYSLDIRNPNNTGTAIARLNQDNATKLWTGAVLARQGIEKWFVGMDNNTDDLLFRRNTASNDMVINNSNGNVTITNLCLSGVCNSSWPSAVNYWTKTGDNISNNNIGNVGIGTTNLGNTKLLVDYNSGNLVGKFTNANVSAYGLEVSLPNATGAGQNVFNLNTGVGSVMVARNDGNIGIGTTSPGAKLSFADLNDGRNTADGITWYNPDPLRYGIYRTIGTWTNPNYQQLKLRWDTGIILDPGKDYGKSYVEIAQGGLRITKGGGTYGGLWVGQEPGEGWIYYGNSATDWKVGKMNTTTNNFEIRRHDDASYFAVTPTGDVGIGTVPATKLHVSAGNTLSPMRIETTSGESDINFLDGTRNYQVGINSTGFYVHDGAYRLTIAPSSGNVGIGIADPGSYKLYVAGDIYTSTSGSSVGGWFTTSDARLKKNVETLSGSLDKIGRIHGVSYNLIDGSLDRQIGVIAQELEQEFPELVKTDSNGFKTVSYDKLSAVLIESVKELKSQNQTIQQRLDILEKK